MLNIDTFRLTQQWCNTFRDGVGHTERQQQDTDDWGSQPSHNEMEVDISDPVGIHLEERAILISLHSCAAQLIFSSIIN